MKVRVAACEGSHFFCMIGPNTDYHGYFLCFYTDFHKIFFTTDYHGVIWDWHGQFCENLLIISVICVSGDCGGGMKKASSGWMTLFLGSLLSDSNQRPRDYKSRALAN